MLHGVFHLAINVFAMLDGSLVATPLRVQRLRMEDSCDYIK
jgi:hypothetical protein